jgi:hypothetical protein
LKSINKFLPIAIIIGFFLFGLNAFFNSKPSTKNARVYKTVQTYSPYYLEKRFGGLQIRSKEDANFKEKPTNATFFTEFARLEKEWGKKHLLIKNNTLIIQDNNGSNLSTLLLNTPDELAFIHSYYGI